MREAPISGTTWELHRRGTSIWVTAECPRSKNGCVMDVGEVRAVERSIFIDQPDGSSRVVPNWQDRMADWNLITFKHCGTSEKIPGKILNGEVTVIVEKPLASGKVQYI